MRDLSLASAPVLSRSTVDRSEPLRADTARQVAMWPSARLLLVDPAGKAPIRDGQLALRPAGDVTGEPLPDAVLLGETGGTAYWGLRVPEAQQVDGEHWRDLRGAGAELDETDAGLLTTAVAVLGWHDRAGFCAVCGSPTARRAAGWARYCLRCHHEEYPRTDPSMIVLVRDVEDTHVLVARQLVWPEGRFSVLAGFVEAGESLEACVQREVYEEVGARVWDVSYLGSQPWPFPRSLMIGFGAVADRDEPLVPADNEIAEARWVSRTDMREALAEGAWSDREGEVHGSARLIMPPSVSIARRMLEAWAGS